MSVFIDEKTKRFFLAGDEWVPAVGHEIRGDKYRFCAIQTKNGINISEITSGSKVHEIP